MCVSPIVQPCTWLKLTVLYLQKNEPSYNFVAPHRNPLRCSVGALAIMLHFMFDQGDLISRVPGWDWGNASSWRQVRASSCITCKCLLILHNQVRLMFGRTVDKPMTSNGISKMYKGFLDSTTIQSTKKAHLARRAVPTILEDMGYVLRLLSWPM
jgi:hypothetical protein